MDHQEREYLNQCKKLIGQKFSIQAGISKWTQKDFEYLSDKIDKKSGVVLSLSTLKRIWKKDFNGSPHATTLNALVSVLGYSNWWEFKSVVKQDNNLGKADSETLKRRPFLVLLSIALASIALLLFVLGSTFRSADSSSFYVPKDVAFTLKKTVDFSVPATVLFDYDVSEVIADSFSIQQSWNENYREPIDQNNHTFSSIYYYPGYHKAKLVANDSIIKIEPIHILTDGWMSYVIYDYYQKIPIYLKEASLISNGILSAPDESFVKNHIELDRYISTNYINIMDFGNLGSDNFSVKASMKCESQPAMACHTMELVVHTQKHIFYIPISTIGCVHNNVVKVGETYLRGRDYDLSKFSADVFEWQEISMVVNNRKADIFINERLIESVSFKEEHGKIVGLNCRFIGNGSVDYIRLSDEKGEVVFEDTF